MNQTLENKRVLITGGAGFIGSTLTELLIEKNRIPVYDNFARDALSSKSFKDHPNLSIVKGNVLDVDLFGKTVTDFDPLYIVHCAAVAGIMTVVESPTETMRVNMIGTANALAIANKLQHLERFVDFSTSEVFGSLAFRAEETSHASLGQAGEARWTYAVSKLAGEHLSAAYHKEFGMPTVMVRPFNVYGPGQVGDSAMRIFIRNALADKDITIYGEGSQIRAWCFVDDFVDGLMKCLTHPKATGESFNIGNARTVITVLGLAEAVLRVLESKSKIIFKPALSADIELRIPSVKKAREVLGFEAQVGLEEGIRRTADAFREQGLVHGA